MFGVDPSAAFAWYGSMQFLSVLKIKTLNDISTIKIAEMNIWICVEVSIIEIGNCGQLATSGSVLFSENMKNLYYLS